MTHKRQTIRDNLTTLLTGLTTTASNVFPSRVYPVEASAPPALLIYVGSEEADEESDSMGNTRTVAAEINIEVRDAKSTGLDDRLDTILEEVQAAIAGDRKLSGTLRKRIDYLGIDGPEWNNEGDQEHASMIIQYRATYEVTL